MLAVYLVAYPACPFVFNLNLCVSKSEIRILLFGSSNYLLVLYQQIQDLLAVEGL